MANGYLHSAFESIPGNEVNTPTLSTKVLYTPLEEFDLNPNVDHLDRDDELRNIDQPLQVLPQDYEPDWALTTRMYPDTVGFELKNMLGPPVTTAGNGVITDPDGIAVPTGASRHVFTAPFGPSGINPQTAQRQAAYKDQSTFFKMKGCATQAFSIDTPDKGGAQLKTSGPALYIARIADPALAPAYEALTVPPFMRGNLQIVTWLGSTAETEDFNLVGSNPVVPISTLGVASLFPDAMEKDDPPIIWTGSIPKRVINATDWDALIAATGFTVKVRWKSTVFVTGAYPYQLWFEASNAQYMTGGPSPLANRRRLGASFDFKCTYGGSAAVTITLVNGTASYA